MVVFEYSITEAKQHRPRCYIIHQYGKTAKCRMETRRFDTLLVSAWSELGT